MSHNNKKKDNNDQQGFEFCEVCKLNHNQGRRHNYFPSHKTSLSTLLTRFQSKLPDVKFFLRSPMPIRPGHAHQNRFWCVFCNCDIFELDSPFACGNSIQHLASMEHWKKVKGFMWKYGVGMDHVDLFRITEVDFAKWEKKCKTLKTEAAKSESIGPLVGPLKNIHTEMNADSFNSFHKIDIDSHNFFIPNGVVPLHSYTNERNQVSSSASSVSSVVDPSSHYTNESMQVQHSLYSTGYMDKQHCSSICYSSNGSVYSGVRMANGENISAEGFMKLTQISFTHKQDMEQNVHNGAPPPWFDVTNENQLHFALKPEQNDPVLSKAKKSLKLNPKRVGAAWADRRKLELELEKRGELNYNHYDANWLPNFGRVWQSGTRKESRKEFQIDSKASSRKADDQTEMLMPLQPYISKRMRTETKG